MDSSADHDRAEQLLSQRSDRLPVSRKERVFERVIARQAPARSQTNLLRWFAWSATAALVALTIPLFLLSRQPLSPSPFSARGATTASSPAMWLGCGVASAAASGVPRCRHGARLVFRLDGVAQRSHFAAVAEGPRGTTFWYFPADATQRSLQLSGAGELIVPRAVVIGKDHPPGRYTVYGVLSSRPLSQDDVRSALGDTQGASRSAFTIISRKLEVVR
ncbi:MAG: hypothetical protein H6707_05615 [Deltaproteobacteria bacterium]|nr:hypothetical protein [Deltaproteobacteria bacterium]